MFCSKTTVCSNSYGNKSAHFPDGICSYFYNILFKPIMKQKKQTYRERFVLIYTNTLFKFILNQNEYTFPKEMVLSLMTISSILSESLTRSKCSIISASNRLIWLVKPKGNYPLRFSRKSSLWATKKVIAKEKKEILLIFF